MNRTNVIEDLTLLPLPPWWLDPWVVAAAVVALLVLAAAGVALARALRRRPAVPAPKPAGPPPHHEYLRRLAGLRARRDTLTAYPLGIEASEILRGYIDARFGFPVLFQTTREFLLHAAGREELGTAQRAALARFLGLADEVKFARLDASTREQDELLDTAEAFIRECAGTGPAPRT